MPRPVLDATAFHGGKQSICCFVPKPEGDSPVAVALEKTLRQALAGTGPHLETTAPPTVLVRPVRTGKRVVVHLLNMDYDDGQDQVKPTEPFKLAVPLPTDAKGVDGQVSLLTPDAEPGDTTLPHTVREGRVEVEVPRVKIWSCVSFVAK